MDISEIHLVYNSSLEQLTEPVLSTARTVQLSARARHHELGHMCTRLAHGRGLLDLSRLLCGWELYDY